jgi:hypothetical protein
LTYLILSCLWLLDLSIFISEPFNKVSEFLCLSLFSLSSTTIVWLFNVFSPMSWNTEHFHLAKYTRRLFNQLYSTVFQKTLYLFAKWKCSVFHDIGENTLNNHTIVVDDKENKDKHKNSVTLLNGSEMKIDRSKSHKQLRIRYVNKIYGK